MSPTPSELEESYRDRRVGADRAVRLQLESIRASHNPRSEQANYRNGELVYTSLAAAIREVNAKFEDAPQQLVADRVDAVNQSLRAEVRQLIIQLVTAHSLGQRVLAMSPQPHRGHRGSPAGSSALVLMFASSLQLKPTQPKFTDITAASVICTLVRSCLVVILRITFELRVLVYLVYLV